MSGLEIGLLLALVAALAAVVGLANSRRRLSREADTASRERASAVATKNALAAELSLQRAQLESLGAASNHGLALLDLNRRILWANEALRDLFGSSHPVVGEPFIALVRDVELNQAVIDAQSGRRPVTRQSAVSGRDLRLRAVPIEDTGGIAVLLEDATELQRLGRARRDLVANISHELRTPLANIDLAAQTLRGGGFADPVLAERMLAQIGQQVDTLSQLSQEILDLARIESGQVLLKLLPQTLDDLVRQTVATMQPQASKKHLSITTSVSEGLRALMDEVQVGRVLGNLLHNAIKFTPDGGRIAIGADILTPDDVRVYVADSGPGIPPGEQGRIFERFYKQDRARSTGGTGLGLAIARHIVEGHGGRIWVDSADGQGATFSFTLPRA